jgi:hypothetical protein
MAFDINQRVLDRNGEVLEKKSIEYREQLLQLFEESPEFQALLDEGIEPGWTGMLLDFGLDYLGVTPPQMTSASVREILFELFPRKVTADANEAPGVIRELHAFWEFLQREFHLQNASAILKVLDDSAARRLKEEMNNPANFGMAKSMMMMGLERGFDMTTEEGMQQWVTTYNSELATGGPRIPIPGFLPSSISTPPISGGGSSREQNKARRKAARESKKRNRGRK